MSGMKTTATKPAQLDVNTATVAELRAEYRRLRDESGLTAAHFEAASRSAAMEWLDGEEEGDLTPRQWVIGARQALAEERYYRRIDAA